MDDAMHGPMDAWGAPQAEFSANVVLEGESEGARDAPREPAVLEEAARNALRTIYDPEIPVNIYDLGLVYGVTVSGEGQVHVRMTLTAPACPMAGWLVQQVHKKMLELPGATAARTELVWDPPWTPARMSEAARLELGLF